MTSVTGSQRKKRQRSVSVGSQDESQRKNVAHNLIEAKYRTRTKDNLHAMQEKMVGIMNSHHSIYQTAINSSISGDIPAIRTILDHHKQDCLKCGHLSDTVRDFLRSKRDKKTELQQIYGVSQDQTSIAPQKETVSEPSNTFGGSDNLTTISPTSFSRLTQSTSSGGTANHRLASLEEGYQKLMNRVEELERKEQARSDQENNNYGANMLNVGQSMTLQTSQNPQGLQHGLDGSHNFTFNMGTFPWNHQ